METVIALAIFVLAVLLLLWAYRRLKKHNGERM
jgi:cbb3-type cytochrome oxidase subunit 3